MDTQVYQMKFREKLAKLLQEREWSVGELARKAGIPYATAKSYLQSGSSAKKTRVPSVKHLGMIARALGGSVLEFMDCEEFLPDENSADN